MTEVAGRYAINFTFNIINFKFVLGKIFFIKAQFFKEAGIIDMHKKGKQIGGGWGAGFVLALSKKWKQPEMEYRECFRKKINFELGKIQPVKIEDNIHVVNMVAQNGYRTANNPTPLDYNALSECLNTVMVWIDENNFISPVIYCPKIGTGLSGGDWEHIKEILQNELSEIPIRVYEL
jgi:hypothetical protein